MKQPVLWILRIVPAVILLQTLFFKFTGAEESRLLFADLAQKALGNAGLEGFLRVGTGVVELVAAVLLLMPRTTWYGAFMTAGTMVGALSVHALWIGFAPYAALVAMGVVALACSVVLLAKVRPAVPGGNERLAGILAWVRS